MDLKGLDHTEFKIRLKDALKPPGFRHFNCGYKHANVMHSIFVKQKDYNLMKVINQIIRLAIFTKLLMIFLITLIIIIMVIKFTDMSLLAQSYVWCPPRVVRISFLVRYYYYKDKGGSPKSYPWLLV